MIAQTDTLVIAAIDRGRGTITLNRPAALNALTMAMVRDIHAALRAFERDPAVALISIDSTRDGCFCAGGDIRAVREARLAGRDAEADGFFAEEFDLNLAIARCAKPYVALIDGICMGGGMGLSVHGAHRVVSDRLVMAMPEAVIGYFPDIGASYFLNALTPGETGLYIALTGARLSAADALYCGLGTACVPRGAFAELAAELSACGSAQVGAVIDRFSIRPDDGVIEANRAVIDDCFSAETIEGILARLEANGGAFAALAREKMLAASPASLRITLNLLRAARGRTLDECLEVELAVAKEVTRGADFAEGVRAMLVDKDRNPRWGATGGGSESLCEVKAPVLDERFTNDSAGSVYRLCIGPFAATAEYERTAGVLTIIHVFADEGLRGTGAAGQLMQLIVADARAIGIKIVARCPYAAAWFEKHPD